MSKSRTAYTNSVGRFSQQYFLMKPSGTHSCHLLSKQRPSSNFVNLIFGTFAGSSKGLSNLSLSWKPKSYLYLHCDMVFKIVLTFYTLNTITGPKQEHINIEFKEFRTSQMFFSKYWNKPEQRNFSYNYYLLTLFLTGAIKLTMNRNLLSNLVLRN